MIIVRLLSPERSWLVGNHQSLLGYRSRHCDGINHTHRQVNAQLLGVPRAQVSFKADEAFPSAYLLVSTIGICEDNCKLIRRSIRRSIWYHNAVLGEMTFSNTATYLNRNPMSSSSTAAHLLM